MKGVLIMAQAVNINFKLDADIKKIWNRYALSFDFL